MMGRESKKASVKQGQPITDFFTRKTVASYQPKLLSTGGQSHPLKLEPTKAYPPSRLDKPVVSVSSDSSVSVSTVTRSTIAVSDAFTLPSTRTRTFMEAVEIVSPPKAAKSQNGFQHLQPPLNTSLKRPHSPDVQNIASPNSRSPRHGIRSPGNPRSRKSKFDSDSDHGQPESVVYISKSAQPGSTSVQVAPFSPKVNLTCASSPAKLDSRKKPRLSSPFLQPLTEDFVPGSLSDEDMTQQISQVYTRVKKKIVDDWLQSTPLSSAARLNSSFDDMDVDVNASSSEKPSSAFMGSTSSTLFTSPTCDRKDTPPPVNRPSSLSPPPPSPMALDKEAETARIIADITAKAYAANMDSPLDSPPAAFKEELDDSSDEEDLFLLSSTKGKGKGNLSKMELPQSNASSSRRSGRYSHRSREQSPFPSTSRSRSVPSSTSRPARAISSRPYVAPTQAQGRKSSKAKVYDPLEELLKEKRLADKRGKGDEAFRLAEVALAGRDTLLEEMNEEDWTNEDAARTAVAERERMELKSSPMATDTAGDEMVLDAEDKQRLFGEARGKAIEDILDGDRAKTRLEKANERVLGVALWSEGVPESDDHMAIDNVVAMPELNDSHSILRLVKTSVDSKDYTQATLLMDSGAIASISFTDHPSVISYFCSLALLDQEDSLSASSFRLLRHIWDNPSRPAPGISFSCILSCLVRIGAKSSVLERMGWMAPGLRHDSTAMQKRDDILYRLVALLTSSARSRTLSNVEVPDILIAMLLVANEPSSSVELQREIMLAIDEVCQSIASGADISASLECAICTRVLSYTSTLEPINKAYIVSVFEGGSGRTRRLARWIAHAIITDKPTIAVKTYNDLPPLLPVYEQLVGKSYDGDVEPIPGKLEFHRKTDYVNMGIYVQILSVALSNVMAYVARECKAPGPRSSTSGSPDNPDKPQPDTMLELIVKAMMALHSRISDTRAAHLERSRTKAALHGVAFRVHYQRLASLRSSTAGTGKPRNLLQYFTK